MLPDAAIELPRKALDNPAMARAVADVRPAQAASRQASDALRRRDKQHRLPFATTLPCCYTEEEVERLINERMQSIEDGTAEFVSHDEVKARIKAMLA